MRFELLSVFGAVALVLLAGGGAATILPPLFHHTLLTDGGLVSLDGDAPVDPRQLAGDAGLQIDDYSLARCIQSEAGVLPIAGKTAVAWAVINYCNNHQREVFELLTAPTGFYGRQGVNGYASTAEDPSPLCVQIAQDVLKGIVPDPTGGADQWDSPWAYKDPSRAETVAASRAASGKVEVVLDEVPERKLRLWRPVS